MVHNWYELSWRQQRAVVRLARQGQRHPDARIARVADDWAWERSGRHPAHGGWLAQLIVGALLGDGASIGEAVSDRRKARVIMRVSTRDRSRRSS